MQSIYPVIPEMLARAEFVVARFRLDLLEPCHLALDHLLGLRQAMLRAALAVPGEHAASLFDPPLSSDPSILKRFQKPSPPLVLQPDLSLAGDWQEGDRLELDVLFLGTGISALGDFSRIMQTLGASGLADGQGRFDLAGVACQGCDGGWRTLRGLPGKARPEPELLSLDEWLDGQSPLTCPIFEILTPARLVTGGRVLRQPRFTQLFPFLLRRVTSMLAYHCQLEPVDDPASLLQAASRVEARWLKVSWSGGAGDAGSGRAGGLTGRLLLGGAELEEVLWVVALGSLFGIGKGAPWGAGRCRLHWTV